MVHGCNKVMLGFAKHRLGDKSGADRGGGHGGPMPPPSELSERETRRFTARLAHVATPMQRISLYESLLHVLQTESTQICSSQEADSKGKGLRETINR